MSEFEYLAVFVAIIFGISLTHILAGAIRSIYRGSIDENQLVWTFFILLVLILNWWTAYSWNDQVVWSFDLFLIILLWATSHYIAAITLYPPEASGAGHPFEHRRNWFLWSFIAIAVLDVAQTAARGDAFSPWYYLPFVSHYALLAFIATLVQKPAFHRWLAWYFLISISAWSLIIRRFLV